MNEYSAELGLATLGSIELGGTGIARGVALLADFMNAPREADYGNAPREADFANSPREQVFA